MAEEKKASPAVVVILIVIIIVAIVMATMRARGVQHSPAVREWMRLTPEEQVERVRQEMTEAGMSEEEIEAEIRRMRE